MIRKTRIIQVYYQCNLCRFWNMIVIIFQSARGCCACETNYNALYYAMPIETTRIVVNQAWISSKLKLIATLWKIWKELFSKHFPRHFQSCKIHVYWMINSLSPVCSHAIRTILMVWVRITRGFQPRVIRTQTINIFSYCMNKQGITNSITNAINCIEVTLMMANTQMDYSI